MATKQQVIDLYKQTLNRVPGDDEINWWLMAANQERWTPAQLNSQFSQAAIGELYTSTLGRSPSPNETAYWTWAQDQLQSPTALRNQFMKAAESELALQAASAPGAARTTRGITSTGLAERTYTPYSGDYTRYGFGPEGLLFTNTGRVTPYTLPSGDKWRPAVEPAEPKPSDSNLPPTDKNPIPSDLSTLTPNPSTPGTVVPGGGSNTGLLEMGKDNFIDDRSTLLPGGSVTDSLLNVPAQPVIQQPVVQQPVVEQPVVNPYSQQITNWYQGLLGRAPDQAGIDYWSEQLRGGLAPDAAQEMIATSPEAMVSREYRMSLGRAPTQDDLGYWVNAAVQGIPISDIRQTIRTSPEAQLFSSYNQAAQNMTLQPYNYYLGQLGSGAPLQGLLSSFTPQAANNGLLSLQ